MTSYKIEKLGKLRASEMHPWGRIRS
jgi:hypothetical protein